MNVAPPPRRSSLWSRVAFFLTLSVALPLAVVEVIVRVFLPQNTSLLQIVRDPHYGWRSQPGSRGVMRHPEFVVDIRIDSLGLRDEGVARAKPAGTFRILGLGDSFAFGQGVPADSCFFAVLERELDAASRSHGGPPVEVVNAGVWGWGTSQEYLYFLREGMSFAPDVVVLAFCVDNDFENNLDPRVPYFEGDRLVTPPLPEAGGSLPRRWARAASAFLTRHSQFVLLARSSLDRGRQLRESARRKTAHSDSSQAAAWRSRSLAVTTRLLDSMAVAAGRADTRLMVFMIPSFGRCVPPGWAPSDYPDPRPHDEMAAHLMAHLDSIGVPIVYPLPELVAASRHRPPYHREGHFNCDGARIAGQALATSLRAAGMVPAAISAKTREIP